MNDPLLQVEHLQVAFPSASGWTPVVRDLSFTLQAGQTLGIVGESGSGKTMTSLAVMGLLPPKARVTGKAWLARQKTAVPDPALAIAPDTPSSNGYRLSPPTDRVDLLSLSGQQLRSYRGDRLAMIFQEPMSALNPVYTCGFQVMETIQVNEGVSAAEARERTLALFEEVQLPNPQQILGRYPHQLSGGQMQRVMIAIALACNPDLLIADEPTTALDVTVQAETLNLLRRLRDQRGMAILFITHDLGVIADIADQVLVMYQGQVVEQGSLQQVFVLPQSPYTKGLLTCRPQLDRRMKVLPTTADFMSVQTGPDGLVEITAKTTDSVRQALIAAEMSATEAESRLRQLQAKPPLLQVNHLKTYFSGRQGFLGEETLVKAVDDVSFVLYPGETLGLVGESGCGKSTLGRSILRLLPATSGEVIFDGDELLSLAPAKLRRLRRDLQMIFQDPFSSLDPRMTVGASIIEPMILHRLGQGRGDRRQRAAALLAKVGLDHQALDRMPHEFSGGQRQRVCIARALATSPRLVICDESVSALDVSVQAQVLNLLKELQAELDLTYLFISHDLSVVKFMSDRIMVMNQGRVEEIASAEQIYRAPTSDYTRKLIAAIPTGNLRV